MELPRGMKDFEPGELAGIEEVRSRFLDLARIFDFSVMEPSPIESLSTLEAKGGPAIRDEIYFFRDKGNRDVALRFDFTVGMTRYVASQKSLRMPAKFATFGGVFRYDEPQKGRYRYFHQWNVETYGRPSIESEAEVIEFTARLFDALGLKESTVDISHRMVVESYVAKVFGSTDPVLLSDILRAVDKVAKKPRREILQEFEGRGYDPARLEKVIEFSSVTGTPSQVQVAADVSSLDSWDHLVELFDALRSRNVGNARINLAIVRGLDYYSGTVFEVFDPGSGLGALAGGGRYDSLARSFGRDDFGAMGVAGGVERIAMAMRERGIGGRAGGPGVSVLYAGRSLQGEAVRIASALRRQGIATRVDLAGRPLKKQISAASDSRFAVIVGQDELLEGAVVLRDMRGRTESRIPVERLLSDPWQELNLRRPG